MTTLLGRLPCAPYPVDCEYKTIGLAACPDCETMDCWLHYLRWEVERGITLNEQHHHLVKASNAVLFLEWKRMPEYVVTRDPRRCSCGVGFVAWVQVLGGVVGGEVVAEACDACKEKS